MPVADGKWKSSYINFHNVIHLKEKKMLQTNGLSIEELHETCKRATATANAAEQRIQAWGILRKGVAYLLTAYEVDGTVPLWLKKLNEYTISLASDRVEKLHEIATNARSDAARCLEVHQMRMDI